MHTPRRTLRRALLVAPVVLASCVWPAGDDRVFVFSDPPGATVSVDGVDTGQSTPAILDLGGFMGGSHRVGLRKAGYEPEERTVSHHTRWGTSRWRDGVSDVTLPPLPLWWTTGDMLFPFEVRWTYVPHNLFVKLFPEGTFKPQPIRETIGRRAEAEPDTTVAGGDND